MIKKTLGLLTVLFGFVGLSFGYDVVGYGGQIEVTPPDTAVIGNYVYVFNNNGNIVTDNYGQYLFWNNKGNNDINLKYVYGWINGKLYFAGFYNNSIEKQGFVQKFSVCNEGEPTNSSKCLNLSITAEDFYNSNPNITKLIVGAVGTNLQNFFGNEPFRLCYFNSNDSQYYCVQNAIRTSGYLDTPLSGSLSFTNINSLSNGTWGPTPFSPSKPVIPSYERGEGTYTNQDIIDGYNAMGLTDGFCYGGFPIDDIFDSGENPDSRVGYQWGSGASILDIWDNYKTAYNNDYISFLRTFYISYENKNYNAFYGYPKSLYSFFNQWSVIDLSSVGFNSYMSDFTITNIWEYCNLKFNSNPNATYTGNSWKPGFAYDSSGVVNNKGRFDFSGNSLYFSGSLSGFNSPSDFFGSLNSIFQNGLGSFNDIRQPLLPSYIIIFMLAIIFIRIISH